MKRAPSLVRLLQPLRITNHQAPHLKITGKRLHIAAFEATAFPAPISVARSAAAHLPRHRQLHDMVSASDQSPQVPTAATRGGSGEVGKNGRESNEQCSTEIGAALSVAAASGSTPAPEPELPPLTPEQFRVYNRLAETMTYFHDHFRNTWNMLYSACESGRRPGNMSLKQFIDEGIRLTQYLTAHHGIEETHLFPLLGRKMPEFRSGGKGNKGPAGDLLQQHREIHAGMDAFEDYLRKCRSREIDLELGVMKEKMDSWGPVLLLHLDQEVETLRAGNMRKYWTMDEMRAIPI